MSRSVRNCCLLFLFRFQCRGNSLTKSLHGGAKMRLTPATSVLAGNLFQSILHSPHRHASNQRTDGQHDARQSVLPPLSPAMHLYFPMIDSRTSLEPSRTFVGSSLFAFRLDELQQTLTKLACQVAGGIW